MKKAIDSSGRMKVLAGVAAVALWASIPAAGLLSASAGVSHSLQQTPTPTPSPTLTPTATPTVSPTVIPTVTPIPSPDPSPTMMM